MLPSHEKEVTQDFLFNNGKRFTVTDAAAFLKEQWLLERGVDVTAPMKKIVSATARGANAALKAVGLESANFDFVGHPPKHILADSFYAQAALRYGDFIPKLGCCASFDDLEGSGRRKARCERQPFGAARCRRGLLQEVRCRV